MNASRCAACNMPSTGGTLYSADSKRWMCGTCLAAENIDLRTRLASKKPKVDDEKTKGRASPAVPTSKP